MKQLMPVIALAGLLALPAIAPAAPDRVAQLQEPQVVVIGLIGERAILRINGQQAILRRDETRDGVTLLGVSNGEALLRIGTRELRLGMGKDTGGIAARGSGASVEIAMNGNGQFITNGMINGRVVEFLVDTGANSVSMTTVDAQRLGIDYRVEGTPASSATAGGIVKAWMVRLRSVQVGPITVKNVQASVRESPINAPILLGMTFLSQVSMQQENNRLRLTAR
jgi:aspartyl protease family protein